MDEIDNSNDINHKNHYCAIDNVDNDTYSIWLHPVAFVDFFSYIHVKINFMCAIYFLIIHVYFHSFSPMPTFIHPIEFHLCIDFDPGVTIFPCYQLHPHYLIFTTSIWICFILVVNYILRMILIHVKSHQMAKMHQYGPIHPWTQSN